MIVLNELLPSGMPSGLVPGAAVGLGEEPTLVAVHGGLDHGRPSRRQGVACMGGEGIRRRRMPFLGDAEPVPS